MHGQLAGVINLVTMKCWQEAQSLNSSDSQHRPHLRLCHHLCPAGSPAILACWVGCSCHSSQGHSSQGLEKQKLETSRQHNMGRSTQQRAARRPPRCFAGILFLPLVCPSSCLFSFEQHRPSTPPMASYTIQRAGSTSSAGRQAAITLLPDDLLAYAFSWLDFQERWVSTRAGPSLCAGAWLPLEMQLQ